MIYNQVKKTNPEIESANNLSELDKIQNPAKLIDIQEFREKGYLQELNRRFLHPLGLTLCVKVSENGDEELYGIIDNREEGVIVFDEDIENSKEFKKRIEYIDSQLKLFLGK